MLMKILIFMLFLGPLVFFHELGHFLFARLFGVTVEVFSIGFGPKLFKWKRGETEYALSLIPLGGYVKMFGDDPLNKENISEEDKHRSFVYKSKWARFWIVFGGPLANFLLAFAIFYALFLVGEKIPEHRLGVVPKESKLYQLGFRSADVLKKINGKTIFNPADIVLEEKGTAESMTVVRDGIATLINTKNVKTDELHKEILKSPPLLHLPIIVNQQGEMFALSGNRVEEGQKIDFKRPLSLFPVADKIQNAYLYKLKEKKEELKDSLWESQPYQEMPIVKGGHLDFLKDLANKGYYTVDLRVRSISAGDPADKAGIKAGDVISTINGKRVYRFLDLREEIQKAKEKTIKIGAYRNGKLEDFSLTPIEKTIEGQVLKLIGIYSGGGLAPNLIQMKSKGPLLSIPLAASRTWDTFKKTLDGFQMLITGGKQALKQIGGPLSIGKMAASSFNFSLTYFLQLMALISINLGIINLFPIPVLDGGHIMFIVLEIINRGPVSRRKMEIAQQVGLSLLLLLMVFAIYNDFARLQIF